MTEIRELGRNVDRSSHDGSERASAEHNDKQNKLPHAFPLMEFKGELSTRPPLQSQCLLQFLPVSTSGATMCEAHRCRRLLLLPSW